MTTWEPRQSRATTWFKFYSESYLLGSTRSELTPEERSVWVDFLCLATINYGKIEVYSRDQLARQLLIERELLDRSIEKFLEFGKVKRRYSKREKKEIFSIVKWLHFQASYLTKRQKKSETYKKNNRSEKEENSDTNIEPTLQERKGQEITPKEITLKENTEDDSENLNSNSNKIKDNSPLPSIFKTSTRGEQTIKDQFLSVLKECKGYPFDKFKDSIFFDTTVKECPNINVIKQLAKKIEWWKKHPDALKANPRQKLQEWFKEDQKFQKRGGSQPVGVISKEMDDPDHRRWVRELAGLEKSRKKGKE